ncbi:MAG TPA: hypothetical protein VHN81_10840 [Edaphobacter sp.]|nr:hypothetical protein [Edaphobacter sp.]
MWISLFFALTNPVTWLIGVVLVAFWQDSRRAKKEFRRTGKRRVRLHSSAAMAAGLAFQFMSIAYRPEHAFIAKAKIQLQEKTDEDDDGGPESPIRHLHRQLRRIRRGEPVDRLIWRLE